MVCPRAVDEEQQMNRDQIKGRWKQVTGKAKEAWGKLTEDDLHVVAGRREQLAGKIQLHYGIAKEEADRQILAWERKASQAWFTAKRPGA